MSRSDIFQDENEQQQEKNVIREVQSKGYCNHKQSIVLVDTSIDETSLEEIGADEEPDYPGISGRIINSTDRGFKWRKEVTTFKGRLVAIAVLIALFTPIAILLFGSMNESAKSNDRSGADAFKNDLIFENFSAEVDLDDPSSPQSKAFFWISERNNFQTELYLLTTIAFGLYGGNEIPSSLLESDKEFCQWRWVGCTEDGKVSKIELHGEYLSGFLASEIMHLTELKFLSICKNDVGGTIPSEVGNLALEALNLEGNNFSGSIPESIWGLKDLKVLDLGGNRELKGTISKKISSMAALEILDITDCSMYGSIPSEIGTLNNLQTFRLGSNPDLNGPIPIEIGQLKMLKDFDIANSVGISGTIPTEFGKMKSLENINLSFNLISGTIPTEIGTAGNLKSFTTMSNPLQGTIPAELGNLHNLVLLNFKSSSLVGSVPSEFGMLTNLEILEVSGNFITGTIPIEFGNMRKISEINFCENHITGPVPDEWCMNKSIFVRYDCECCKNCY